MGKKFRIKKSNEYPSLYDDFKPGERVVRRFEKESGEIKEYEGMIMAMDSDYLEVYWDTIDGDYNPDLIDEDFTICDADEVYNGTIEFSPIQQKKKRIIDYLNIK